MARPCFESPLFYVPRTPEFSPQQTQDLQIAEEVLPISKEELLNWLRNYRDEKGYIKEYSVNFEEELVQKIEQKLAGETVAHLRKVIKFFARSQDRKELIETLKVNRLTLVKTAQILYLFETDSRLVDISKLINLDLTALNREVFLEHIEKLSYENLRKVVINILEFEGLIVQSEEESEESIDDYSIQITDFELRQLLLEY